MQEIFKDITSFEGKYQISNFGNVKALNYHRMKKEYILKPYKDKDGYLRITLYKDGTPTKYFIHVLVALNFVDGWFENAQVDHINTIKDDNMYTNLRWVTASGNARNEITYERKRQLQIGNTHFKGKHHSDETKHKIAKSNSKPIVCVETGIKYYGATEASSELNISRRSICSSCNDEVRTAGGFHWKYI